jgi:two-component system LytT family response regulator
MPWTTLVVDDEPLAREGLLLLLARDPEIGTVHQAADGAQAVEALRTARPDLVLLDVQMPEMDGFAVVRAVGAERMPPTVFVTAHDRYAIDAFEINAVDYLLKPVAEERFARALGRVKDVLRRAPTAEASRQILGLLESLATPRRHLKRLAVRTAGKTAFVDVSDLDYVRAAENYVELHVGSATHLLHVPLNTLEASLDPQAFLRVHRSLIVNVARIKELRLGAHGEYLLTLASGVQLQCGRTYSDRLRALATNPF